MPGTQRNRLDDHITQLTGDVSAGRDLSVLAGRDITAVAGQIAAKNDVSMSATENLTLSSAADEDHTYSKGKHTTRQTDHVAQLSTTVTAGGNVVLSSGQDMTLVSSNVTAGNEAYLVAGGQLGLLAAQNSDYSLYDMKKKGSFGSKRSRKDETTQVTNIGSQVTSGGDLALISGGDQIYQAAKLDSGNDLLINSGGAITFEGVKDLHQEDHEKSSSSMAWTSMSGKGSNDETLQQTEMTAKGQTVINAVNGLNIDIKQIDKNTVSQTIDAMVQADPQLAWLKEADKRGNVDWRQVKELHDSFKYSSSSLGEGAMLAIIIIVTVLTAGAASTLAASAGSAMGAGSTMAAAAGATSAGLGNIMVTGALTSIASNSVVSVINNKGNLGAALGDITSSDSLKGYVSSALMAGVGAKLGYDPTKLSFNAPSAIAVAKNVAAQAVIRTIIYGGSYSDNLVSATLGAAVSIGGAIGANKIGDLTLTSSEWTKIAMHAGLGGLMAEAMGGDFRAGALAAGANEAMVDFLASKLLPDSASANYQQGVQNLLATSQFIGVLAAAVTGGDAGVGAAVAANGTQNNYLNHTEMVELANKLKACEATKSCGDIALEYVETHLANQKALQAVCAVDMAACQKGVLDIYNSVLGYQNGDYDVGLGPDSQKILNAFHNMNLDSSAAPTAAIAMPSADAFIEALGLDPTDPKVKATAVALATLIVGKASAGSTAGSLGSTGRTIPASLNEQLAMEEVMSNPSAGKILAIPLNDARWPSDAGWAKMAQNVNGIDVHYVRNSVTGAVDDFKFK